MSSHANDLHAAIRQVLLDDWDPTNAARSDYAAHTYDAYIAPLLDLIRSGADEEAVMTFLHEREREIMCFPGLGTERLRRPVRKLLRLVKGA